MLPVLQPARLGCCNKRQGAASSCSVSYETHSSTFLQWIPKSSKCDRKSCRVRTSAGLGPGWAGSHSLGAQAHPGTPGSGSPARACRFSCRGGCRYSGSCSCTQHRGRWQSHEAQTVVRWPARHRPLWLPSQGCASTHAKAPPPHQGCGRRCPSREEAVRGTETFWRRWKPHPKSQKRAQIQSSTERQDG